MTCVEGQTVLRYIIVMVSYQTTKDRANQNAENAIA